VRNLCGYRDKKDLTSTSVSMSESTSFDIPTHNNACTFSDVSVPKREVKNFVMLADCRKRHHHDQRLASNKVTRETHVIIHPKKVMLVHHEHVKDHLKQTDLQHLRRTGYLRKEKLDGAQRKALATRVQHGYSHFHK